MNAIWGSILFSVGYVALALACLRQWGTSTPWARVDVFSGTFLGLMILTIPYELYIGRATLRSREVFREASGMTYDTRTLAVGALLSAGDLLVFLDYGHWHLARGLAQHIFQGSGIALDAIAVAWLLWADTYLARHFRGALSQRVVMQDGPFHYVRHPRYAGTLAIRIAFALVFASVIAWLLALAWLLVLLRRIRLEERHLQELFGGDYGAYRRRTPRLLPGVY